jgi:hypothetical protein
MNNVDMTGPVKINTRQYFRSGKLEVRNPADTFSYILAGSAIVADRTVTEPLLTANDTRVYEAFVQTLTNKTIVTGYNFGDTTENILKGTGCDNPYCGAGSGATLRRTGLFPACASAEGTGYVGGTLTAIGTSSSARSTIEGFGQDYDTTALANANAGLRQGAARFRREWGMYCKGRLKISSTSDIRLFIGWSSDTAEIAGETTLNNFSGVGIGKRTGDTNWFTMRNDGDATEDRVDTTIAANTNFFTFELQLDATNFRSSIGGVEQTAQTTEIPASATDLAFHCEIETGSGAASKVITILPIFFRSG